MNPAASILDRTAQAEQRRLTNYFALIFVVGGVGCVIASLFDSDSGLFTSWDNYGTAITSVLYFVSGLLIYLRPQWLNGAVLLSAIPTAIYEQGVMAVAVHQPSAASLYSAASSGPFFPMFYLVLFIMLPRGASALSWVHCAVFYLQFLLNSTLWADPLASPERHQATHFLVELMMSHPVYIVALNYIVRLRERLYATQEAAFKNKEGAIGMLSHEIRNQLQTMVGAIELLDLRLVDAPARRSLARLQEATTQLQTYLCDINELTTLEDPTLRIEKTRFELQPLLDEICSEWLPQAQAKGLSLTLEAPTGSGPPLLIESDKVRLRQIVSNLLSNAIKYTAAGGVSVALGAAPSPGEVTIAVSDSGIGIEAKYFDRICEPHVRLENAKSYCAAGSGLGLTIVERLVSSLGGALAWESQVDRGSRFVVTLPGLVGR